MPILYILAGPNGAGKTTYYETAIDKGFIDSNLPFVNVDLITRSLPGMYTTENFAKADILAREKIKQHFSTMSDFMIESNLATQRDYDWITALTKQGYEVVLFFLCTSFLEINYNRVKKRVAEGGHDIAEPIIEHRYRMGLTYLKGNLSLFTKAYLIDNSGETALVMAELSKESLISKDANAPQWVNDVLYIVERMKK
ncbi:MAG: zeta toxin family protein [Bacteroidetes bacterium]|nr:zeta toxin family protein [Bacteroidota bacterium]